MDRFTVNWYHKDFNFLMPRFWFGQVDTRPMSLFRILFALVMLKDAVYHLFIANEFYSDQGIVPRTTLLKIARAQRFSLMDSVGATNVAQAFFVLWIVVLVLLLLGYRTRLMTILHFILILSIHERNVWILNGGDSTFRVLSFWMMFIPLGQYYSLDALRRRWGRYLRTRNAADLRAEDAPRTAFAFPIRMIQIQFALIYVFTFVLKLPYNIWRDGQALHYALQLESLTLPPGDWFFNHAPYWMLQGMDYYSLLMEGMFVILVFLPFLQPFMRGVGLFMGFMMHFGIAVLMSIDNFSNIMIISYAMFFMPEWVSGLDSWLRLPNRQALKLPLPALDSPLWWLVSATRRDEIALANASENDEGGRDTWIVQDEQGQSYQGAAAWRQVAGHVPLSRLWAWLLKFGVVRGLLWTLGKLAAGQGSLMPERDDEPTPLVSRRALRWANRGLFTITLGILMAMVLWWNLADVPGEDNKSPIRPVYGVSRDVILYSGLWQNWAMFAPYPVRRDGYITAPGRFEDGTVVDLMTGELPTGENLRWFWGPDLRWKKLIANIYFDGGYTAILEAWGSSYCEEYNIDGALPYGKRLATLEIHFNWRLSYEPGGSRKPLQTDVMWRHWCYDQYQY